MDGKIFVYLVVLAGLIGMIAFTDYGNEVDEVTQQVMLSQQQVDSLQSAILFKGETLELRKEIAALLQAIEIMSKDAEVIRDEIKKLRDSAAGLKRSFEQSILRVRADSIGMVLPIVALNNGTTLRNARLQSIEGEIVTMLHSEGISKIPPENLPADLQDRFRFGMLTDGTSSALEPQALRSSAVLSFTAASRTLPNSYGVDEMLRRLAHQPVAKPAEKPKTSVMPRDPAKIRELGDPALWNSATRESLGRAYIPGQGWLRVGPNGPIPGSGRQ